MRLGLPWGETEYKTILLTLLTQILLTTSDLGEWMTAALATGVMP